ncbi:Platinum sensitivity protein [Coemansia sp. RSA 564]|nr:Platinum sensitivity protein [Coemansia sp. RSA 564]
MTPADSQVRVRVYQLDEAATWSDKGVGFCTLEDCQGVLHLNVASEAEVNRLILDCVVQKGEVYQQQEGTFTPATGSIFNGSLRFICYDMMWLTVSVKLLPTLIVWTEPTGEDFALSFEEQEGCQSIFQITEFENAVKENALEQSPPPPEVRLPLPSMKTLPEIGQIILDYSQTAQQRDQLVAFITRDNYFDRLLDLHKMCEDLDILQMLFSIYNIVRHILLLNDSSIFECIVRDENIIGVVSMLEHDPHHHIEVGSYRNFLRSHSQFKEVVPFGNADIEGKVRQTFRLQYLKDVVLQHIIDDGTLSVINALIFFNHAQIANYIHHNQKFLDELFGIIRQHDDPEKMRDVVQFVRQFYTITKGLPVGYRLGLFRTLSQHGLFLVFEYALQQSDRALRTTGADMLMSTLEQDRVLVRSYMLDQYRQQHDQPTLLELISERLHNDPCLEIRHMCCETLRILLDTMGPPFESMDMSTEMMAGSVAEKETDDFLAMFYDNQARGLIAPLASITAADVSRLTASSIHTGMLNFLCDVLTNMVKYHGQRAKKLVQSSGVIKGVSLLLASKHNHLKLSALRFIRVCVGMQDDVYVKYLISQNVVGVIVNLLLEMLPRDNLVASACRELLAFVANYRQSSLLPHLLGAHSKSLEKAPDVLEYLQSAYDNYLLSLEQSTNGGMATPTVSTGRRSAVSISMLVGRDSSAAGHAGSPAGVASGLWSSAVTDEIEDAYLESLDDTSDSATPVTITSTVPEGCVINGISESTDSGLSPKLPPELDSLQDCLDIYSTATDSKLLATSSNSTLESRSPLEQHDPSSSLSFAGDNHKAPLTTQNHQPSAPPMLKRQSSSISIVRRTNGSNHGQSEEHATNGRLSIAEAFPDSRPLSRKLGKRVANGRVGAKTQIKINMAPLARSRAKSIDSCPVRGLPTLSSASSSSGPPFLGKRPRPASSDSLTTLHANGRSPATHQPQLLQNGTGISDGSDLLDSPSLCAKEDAASRDVPVSFSHNQDPPGATVSSPVECRTPPKKARTASS